jgi:serine/threonine-protein kinase
MDSTPPTGPPVEATIQAPPLPASAQPDSGGVRLLEEIARGGMGAVYRGRDLTLGRDLAVKVLLPQAAQRPELHRRFLEEARIAGQLQHPGIVPVHEMGLLPDHRPYFTMKLVKGETLAARIRSGAGRAELLQAFEAVCQAVAYAHAHGVIHRDLKPANVMLGSFGEVLVMDWGLAKVMEGPFREGGTHIDAGREADGSGETVTGSVFGTPSYMPPEQARGEVLDERADVFGLGAILCEILTGKPPFDCGGRDAVAMSAAGVVEEAQQRLSACGADAELIGLARSCIAAEASARPRSAAEVASRMAAYREQVAERLRQAEIQAAKASARAAEEAKRRKLALATAALMVLLAGAVAGGWILVAQQRAAREKDRLLRQADISRRAQAELREAASVKAGNPRAARDHLHRAQALLAEEGGEEALKDEVARLLAQADAEERDARLREGLNEAIHLIGASDPGTGRWDTSKSASRTAAALREWGVTPGEAPPAEAAARIRRLPPDCREALLQALNVWMWSESFSKIELIQGAGPLRVAHVEPGSPASRAGVAGGDTLLALASGEEGEWQEVTGWDVPRAEYWLNAPGQRLLRLRLRGPQEDAPTRTAEVAPGRLVAWLDELTAEVDPSSWRRDARRADREPDLARREAAVARLLREMDGAAEPGWSLVGMAYRLGGIGRAGERVELLRRLTRDRPEDFLAHVHLYLALRAVQPKPREEVRRHLATALALRPDSDTVRLFLAMELSEAGHRDEAIQVTRAGAQRRPGSGALAWALGQILWLDGQDSEALASFRRATALEGASAHAWHAIGLHYSVRARDQARAIEAFQEALRKDPRLAPARVSLALSLEMHGQASEAQAQLERVTRGSPGHWQAWWRLGELHRRARRDAEAKRCLTRAAGLGYGPEAAGVWASLASLATAQGRHAEALAALRRAATLAPSNAAHWRGLAATLASLERHDEAEQALRHVVGLEPAETSSHLDLGVQAWRCGRATTSIRHLARAEKLGPANPEPPLLLGIALNGACRFAEAEAALRRHEALLTGSERVLQPLTRALLGQGKHAEAERMLTSLEADGKFGHEPVCLLAEVYRVWGRGPQLEAAARRAIARAPACAPAYEALAWHLLERGELSAALACARAGLARAGSSPSLASAEYRATVLLAFSEELEAVSRGKPLLARPLEMAAVAWYLSLSPRSAPRAAQLFLAAFTAVPELAAVFHLDAIRAGSYGGPRWRRQALTWLDQATRRPLRRLKECGEAEAIQHRRTLHNLHTAPSLTHLRGGFLDTLPPEEREAWSRLWTAIREALTSGGA